MRYSKFLTETNLGHQTVSYNVLTPKVVEGDPNSLKPKRIKITPIRAVELLGPYSYVRIMDQIKAVVPLALYLVIFQVLVLRQPVEAAVSLTLGLAAVIIGLAVFMEGLNTGLMPFGTIIGNNLPKKANMTVVLIIIAILGVGVTFAEPAIGGIWFIC